MSFHASLIAAHPIRKTAAQKAAFRTWALDQASALGYAARVESLGKKDAQQNIVIGDPASAKVLFTAHYDTPARNFLPNLMMPRNVFLFILYQLLVVGVFIAAAVVLGVGAGMLTGEPAVAGLVAYVVYFGLLFLMLLGPANKHNANDNSSGVAAVYDLMAKLPEAVRGKAAFILFDNEEKGLLGSKAYAKAHKEQGEGTLMVNLDCVGDGDTIIMVVNKLARELPEVALLEKTLQATEGRKFVMFRSRSGLLGSDHKNFKRGIMTCACRQGKHIGYYTPNIHTHKDTWCDEGNLTFLAEGLSAFVAALPEE